MVSTNNKKQVLAVLFFSLLLAIPVSSAFAAYDPQKAFDQAMKDRKEGRVEQAIKGFQSILNNNPKLNRARLELAVAYFYALNFSKAIEEAERVLNDPTTPKAVKTKIKRFLAQIRAASPKSTWKFVGSIGYMFDTNVNVGPDTIITGSSGGQVAAKQSDHAVLLHAGASHRYISGRNIEFGQTSAAFLWLSQIDYYRIDYRDRNTFDLDVLSIGTGPSYIAAKRWRAGVSFNVDAVRLGDDNYALFAGINPNFTWIMHNQKTEVTFELQYQKRDYKRAAEEALGRDSIYSAFGISVGHLFAGDKFSLQGGFRLFDENADGFGFDNDGYELFVGGSWRLTSHTTVYGRVSRRNVEFSGIQSNQLTSVVRDESLDRFVLGLNHTVPSGTFKGWTIRANITRTENDSNAPEYAYDRTQTSLVFEKSFK
jgi:tetratricopeptide (TPR) repeat protein